MTHKTSKRREREREREGEREGGRKSQRETGMRDVIESSQMGITSSPF